VAAAGCGPERHLTVPSPKQRANTLRLTPTGYAQDLIGTWHHRRKKRDPKRPGHVETIINDRQCLAGREIEYMIGIIAGQDGDLRSFDLTVPVVDTSFRHRMPMMDKERTRAKEKADGLYKHLGRRDFLFLFKVLAGFGVHGAMLDEAGHNWRPDDPAAAAAIGNICAGGSGALSRPGAYRIDRDSDSFSPERQKRGGFEVHDRGFLTELGHAGPILPESKCKIPNDPWFVLDQAVMMENAARASRARQVANQRADTMRERRRDQLDDLAGRMDAVSKDRRDRLEELLLKQNEKLNHSLHVRDAEASIGSTVSFEEVQRVDMTCRERAIEIFGIRAVELGECQGSRSFE
jgi:hypothetical protein